VAFRIDWTLPNEAWREVAETRRREPPGSEYDLARRPVHELLNADLQVEADGRLLFPPADTGDPPGFNLSLLDFAIGLARAAGRPTAAYDQADDQLEIHFDERDGVVEVSTNLDRSPVLEVPAAEFRAEADRVVDALRTGLEEHAPGALEWETLAALRR
jgi:hypothetical protein